MIKAVIFDCFGVLTVDSWHAYTSSLPKKFQIEARSITHAYDSGIISESQLIKNFTDLTGDVPEKVVKAITPKNVKNLELLKFIKNLKQQGYKTAILSNVNNNWVTDYFLNEDEKSLFDEFVFSFQVGTAKPDSLMYQTVIEKLELNFEECVFIDDQERYCTAAEDLGMKAIHYKNFADFRQKLEDLIK